MAGGLQMKNHYVSQLIIKRFSNPINIFDIEKEQIAANKKSKNVFYKNDIYTKEIEKLMNFNIESRISNLLDQKILEKNTIELSRVEIELLKRYMLICSIRTLDEDCFSKLLKTSFKKRSEKYINFYDDYKNLPSSDSLNLNNKELFHRTLTVFAQATSIAEMANNPLTTREMIAWALPFLKSYIAFWDAPDNKEFILSDCGMCSEYEGFHMITNGLDLSKYSYLYHKIIKENQSQYVEHFANCIVMYENYNIFVLNSKRSIVMINPFFKMYNHQNVFDMRSNKILELDCPDIWPAIIQDRNLFGFPEVKYTDSNFNVNENDMFTYNPKVLSDGDLIYINNLLLSFSKEIIGFKDITKIIDSIYYHIWYKSKLESVHSIGEDKKEIMNRFITNLYSSKFIKLCEYGKSNGAVYNNNSFLLFEKQLSFIYKDFYENPYIYMYLLENKEETIKCSALDFFGKGDKKIETFKKMLEKINTHRKIKV